MKILFKIKKSVMHTSIYTEKLDEDLNNTNIIDTKELVFSSEYIEKNYDLVSSFISVVLLKNNITTFNIENKEIAPNIINLINDISSINHLILSFKETINYEIFVPLLESTYLNQIDLFDIPIYLLERLDLHKQIKINVKNEVFFLSDFMEINKLSSFSDIYYKKRISINNELKDNELNDFEDFIKINFYLKNIKVINFSKNNIKEIFKLLVTHNKKDIKITINEKDNDLDLIYKTLDEITKTYNNFIKNNNISININYSMEYKKKNLFKYINFTLLKTSLLSISILIFVLFTVNHFKNNKQAEEIIKIDNEIKKLIEEPTEDENTTTKKREPGTYYTKYSRMFTDLQEINPDTVAWLDVNNTRIDYPVVRADNNDYYLNRDFKKNYNSLGWVFMDFRNHVNTLSDNTIIYAHNVRGGLMFGDLAKTFKPNWHKNKNNLTITLNTLYDDLEFEIFSIYRVVSTTDYIITDFNSPKDKVDMFNMVKERSIHQFDTTFNEDDKILTLSTCINSGKDRQVIHAKLKTNN